MSNYNDTAGNSYTGNGSGPATSGAPVTIYTNNGPVSGTMVGTVVVPNT